MTPQEIFEYKQKWRGDSWNVRLHSDLDVRGKDWCRKNIPREEWSMTTWTDVYEHTFYFHFQGDANAFKDAMPTEFVNQQKNL